MVASSHCLAALASCFLVFLVPYGAEGCWRRAGDEKMLDVMRALGDSFYLHVKLAAILDFDAGHFCRDDTDCEAMGNKRMCNVGISRYWKLNVD